MSNYYEGKSGVNVKRLVQNIADQYHFKPQVSAIIELMANSLDANASLIEITHKDGILEFVDNGLGMNKRQFREYHDFAATSKKRGKGIGFAGQGAKLALNFCTKVVSETWSTDYRGYSEWYLKGNDAPYKIFDAQVLSLNSFGTKITLYLDRQSVHFYTEELIKEILQDQYFPLIDSKLKEIYKAIYKDGIRILLNGDEIISDPSIESLLEDKKDIEITVYTNPRAVGKVGRIKNTNVLYPGVMICTFGKVIDRTYFKKEPKEKEKIFGWN